MAFKVDTTYLRKVVRFYYNLKRCFPPHKKVKNAWIARPPSPVMKGPLSFLRTDDLRGWERPSEPDESHTSFENHTFPG
jgi:hypothetical protein